MTVTSLRTRWTAMLLLLPAAAPCATLQEITAFGDNPAGLRMLVQRPPALPPHAALVVALHGCSQDAQTYAQAGWSEYAQQRSFLLLLPEQSALERMTNSCWSWFRGDDSARGSGQAASIVAMIGWLRMHHDIDPRRIFVDGLSAGGWFVPELLADYPDVFAGGAVHAGGPAFCADVRRPFWDWFGWWTTMGGGTLAAQCMRGTDLAAADWSARARAHAPTGWRGPWPRLSIWQGSADLVVSPSNQRELLEQWTALHGADANPEFSERLGTRYPALHQRFDDAAGQAVAETWRIDGMTHGIAIDAGAGAQCGEPSAFVLDVGLCAVRRVGAFWGL